MTRAQFDAALPRDIQDNPDKSGRSPGAQRPVALRNEAPIQQGLNQLGRILKMPGIDHSDRGVRIAASSTTGDEGPERFDHPGQVGFGERRAAGQAETSRE